MGKRLQHLGGQQRLQEPQEIISKGVVLCIVEGRRRESEQCEKSFDQRDMHSFHSRLNPENKLEQESLQLIAEWLSSKLVNMVSQLRLEGCKEFCQHQEMNRGQDRHFVTAE